jgi:hypothetical protein
MAGPSLAYPLHSETLTAGVMFYAVFGALFAAWSATRGFGDGVEILWLVFCASVILVYAGLLLQYGTAILLATAHGLERPPALLGSVSDIVGGQQRVLHLAVVLTLVSGAAGQLDQLGLTNAARLVWLLLFLLLPPLIVNSALVGTLAGVINPLNVVETARRLGWSYPLHLFLLALVFALAYASVSGPALLFLLLFPASLYFQFLLFYQLGLAVHACRDHFLQQVDFMADRAERKAISDSLADVDRELSAAYECLRAGEHARVLDTLDLLIKRSGWTAFEQVFRYVSQWHHPAPALHLCKRYLTQRQAPAVPMRALDLAQWCLARDASFTLANDVLQDLAERAAIPVQYRSVLQLIENHLAQHPDAPQKAELLRVALGLAADKLKDEQSYTRLKAAL